MKKIIKSSLSVALAALMSISMFAQAGEAVADESSSAVSYNIGYMSEYWYRGYYMSESSVSFGADAEMGNFYIGTWWADVDKGVEYDIYGGYNFSLMGVPMYAGFTGYYYSDNFDSDYQEINIGADMGFMSIDAAIDGEYQLDAGDQGYQHYTITVPLSFVGLPIDYQYQTWTGEAITGHNHELHYGMTVSGVDVGLMVGRNIDTSHATGLEDNDDSTYANFTLGYSF
ncbi:MAG: hypothetical protein ISQ60_02830 [Gammaproteobacteria bacterium]|nr:hypothetical protein [Gammaproteobacteria bacterium]MBL6819215.1 hypothetical protein [Gammaproteobacteria bacterium]MBL6898394.1 hypothetical protein [Gammaproteobacteria bacterium]